MSSKKRSNFPDRVTDLSMGHIPDASGFQLPDSHVAEDPLGVARHRAARVKRRIISDLGSPFA